MPFEYPIETVEGNKYVVSLDLFENNLIDVNLGVDVYFVVLEALEINTAINGIDSLMQIARSILNFLLTHDVIIFYMCDKSSDILLRMSDRSKKRCLFPQHYRSILFNKMFERTKLLMSNLDLENKTILFSDLDEPIYMHLISRPKNLIKFDEIELEIYKLATAMK